jgi:branched-subunit amino acid transport protein AzlD
MEIAIGIVLALHLLGFASIFGGLIGEMKNIKTGTAKVNAAVIHGSWLALAAGLGLIGMLYAHDEKVNNLSVSIKGSIITIIFVIAYRYQKKETTPKWVVPTLMLLILINLFVATVMGMTTSA